MQHQWIKFVAFGVCLTLAACSGGDGSENGPYPQDSSGSTNEPEPSPPENEPEPTPPEEEPEPAPDFVITELTPAGGQDDVTPSVSLVADFNQAVDPDTLENGFRFENDDGEPVDGTLAWSSDQKQVRFQPDRALDLGVGYQWSWRDSLTAESGQPLAEPKSVNFTVRSASWHDWAVLSGPYQWWDMPTSPAHLVASAGAQGDVLAGWFQRDDGQSALRVTHYRPGDGWRAPQALSTPWIMRTDALSLSWLDDQRAVAVWHEGHGGIHQVRAALFHYQTGWEEPEQLAMANDALDPRVIVKADGTPVVHWLDQDRVYMSTLQGHDWTLPVQIGSDYDRSLEAYELLLLEDGSRVLVWEEALAEGKQVFYAVVNSDHSLEEPTRVVDDDEETDVRLSTAFVDGDDWLVLWNTRLSSIRNLLGGRWYSAGDPLTDSFSMGRDITTGSSLDRRSFQLWISDEGDRDVIHDGRQLRLNEEGTFAYSRTPPRPDANNRYRLISLAKGGDGRPVAIWRYDPLSSDPNPRSIYVASLDEDLNIVEEWQSYELPGPAPRVPDLYFLTGAQGHAVLLEHSITDDSRAQVRARVFD